MNLSPSQISQTSPSATPIDAKPASSLGLPGPGRSVDAGLFADILSRHWQHLAQNQRQDLAASADATLAAAGRVPSGEDRPTSDPLARQVSDRTPVDAPRRQPVDQGTENDQADSPARLAMTQSALDGGRLPAAPLEANLSALALESTTARHMTNDGLVIVALSERIDIVTTTESPVTAQSVADFARSMGLSELQIEQLFGPQANSTPPLGESISTLERLTAQTGPRLIAPASSPLPSTAEGTTALTWTASAVQIATPSTAQALQSWAAVATHAPSDPNTTGATANATSVDVLTIMEAEFSPEVMQALQARMTPRGQGVLGLTTGTTSAALSQALTSGAALPESSSPQPGPVSGLAPGAPGTHRLTRPGVPLGNPQAHAPVDAQAAYDELNQKFTSELAARVHQQVQSGEWKMKFALKPASLGHLDVQLEMRDGKLTAVFQTDNAMTQDLLSSGSQRLKDALAQLGHSQASVWVGSGQSGQPQGQGRGHQATPHPAHVAQASSDSSSGSALSPTGSRTAGPSQSSTHLDLFA